MTTPSLDSTIARWARLGVLFGGRPARRCPDIERLLIDTARRAPSSARMFHLAFTWLSRYSHFVARHRLKRLIGDELGAEEQPILGAILALAIRHGASRELRIAADACRPAETAGPLFDVHRRSSALAKLARSRAAPEGLRWNLWVPDQPPSLDALRPARWILTRNPAYFERIVRKGDLRCSILLVLGRDTAEGNVESELALAQRCAANRPAVRHALDDLEDEGCVARASSGNGRVRIQLAAATGAARAPVH